MDDKHAPNATHTGMRVGVSLPVRELQNDLGAIRAFAQAAEALGLSHLRVPDQVIRPGNKHLHESLTLLAWLAGCTSTIELVPSVVVLPVRQTALVAKQAAEIDVLSGGRLRLGIGVGGNAEEYAAMGIDFHTRGARCSEQIQLLRRLWREPTVSFKGRFHTLTETGLNPLPVNRHIDLWIGASSDPGAAVIKRIGELANGWFVLATPDTYPDLRARIDAVARNAGRDPQSLGTEAGVAVVGERRAEWRDRIRHWRQSGLSHLCLRTLSGGLIGGDAHIQRLGEVSAEALEIVA